MIRFCKFWSLGVGVMDATTGALLVFWPELVLRIFGISEVTEESLVFLRWIGIFVAGVGLSYGWVLRGDVAGETVWSLTALVRVLVTVFIAVNIVNDGLVKEWAGVAMTDGVVALVQIVGLWRGWWKGGLA